MELNINDIQRDVMNLPESISLAGFAISRQVYLDGSEEPIKASVEGGETNYNWGCKCGGTLRLSEDILNAVGLSPVSARYLAPTFSHYMLENFKDNFKYLINFHAFFLDAFANAVNYYATYLSVEFEENPEYIVVDNSHPQPVQSEPTPIPAKEGTAIVADEFGWRRVLTEPGKENSRSNDLGNMIKDFRRSIDKPE